MFISFHQNFIVIQLTAIKYLLNFLSRIIHSIYVVKEMSNQTPQLLFIVTIVIVKHIEIKVFCCSASFIQWVTNTNTGGQILLIYLLLELYLLISLYSILILRTKIRINFYLFKFFLTDSGK